MGHTRSTTRPQTTATTLEDDGVAPPDSVLDTVDPVPLQQIDTTADVVFAVAVGLIFLGSLFLALFVAWRVLRGYRANGERRLLLFGVGVLCIVFVSKVSTLSLNVAVPSFRFADSVAAGWRVVGGACVLYAIYRGGEGQ